MEEHQVHLGHCHRCALSHWVTPTVIVAVTLNAEPRHNAQRSPPEVMTEEDSCSMKDADAAQTQPEMKGGMRHL